MKKIIMILISAIMAFGCEKTVGFDSHEGDIVEVSLSLIGDITVNDSSLDQTRAGDTESNDLIGIQVYEGSSPYAYGLFDNLAGKSIYLHSDKTLLFTLLQQDTDLSKFKTQFLKVNPLLLLLLFFMKFNNTITARIITNYLKLKDN